MTFEEMAEMLAKAPPSARERIAAVVTRVRSLPRDQWATALAEELDKLEDVPDWMPPESRS